MHDLIYGVAYYDEYMPLDRLDEDIRMMRDAGINTVRIAESTWSTLEPQPGRLDFSSIDRVLAAMAAAGIDVIIGTPTYAVPSWLVKDHPEVLATTHAGPGKYGARQIMDITSPAYLFHAERVIRALCTHVADSECVVGFQLDNETKYFDTASTNVQRRFGRYLHERFHGDLAALNSAFGLDYWSNRIDSWQDVPDVLGTINGSLGGAFDQFRRGLAAEFLQWQAGIVGEYVRPDQFITHNFDFSWEPGHSYGLQAGIDHFEASGAVTVAGCDIYHPTASHLTGKEIAFGGDVTRSIKDGAQYLVLETQAQGQTGWLPYPGQLRLQAFSHLASGARGVSYWHWHSIHNSFETYWKGLLSQDFEPNRTYREACTIGADLKAHTDALAGLTKANRAAIIVSNESQTALTWFQIETGFPFGESISYNDVLRSVYDALYELNIEVDFVSASQVAGGADLGRYTLVTAPALYQAPESVSDALRAYVADGGHLVATFRSFVADENTKVWHDRLPHALTDVFGSWYSEFTRPDGVRLELAGTPVTAPAQTGTEAEGATPPEARALIELLEPADGAEVTASYAHRAWQDYAAVVRNRYGDGSATYIGTLPDPATLRALLEAEARAAGLWGAAQEIADSLRVRTGVNGHGRDLTYLLNYSPEPVTAASPVSGTDVLGAGTIAPGESVTLAPWGVLVIEGPEVRPQA